MHLTLYFVDEDHGRPLYRTPVLLHLETGEYRIGQWRWRRDTANDEWESQGQHVPERVLRWAHLPSGDPEKDHKRTQRAIRTQTHHLTQQAAKEFSKQIAPAILAAIQATLQHDHPTDN